MKITFSLLTVLLLSACSSENQVYGLGMVPQNVTGDANSVDVFNVWSGGDALPLAQRHCQGFGKNAEFARMSGITAKFTCV